MRTRNGIRVGILGLFIVAAMLLPGVALAADFTVTTTADGDDKECSLDCTLREAVALAGPNDRVLLPSGTYQLTMGELSLIAEEIVGAGARTTAIDGAGNSRVLRVNEGTTLVSGVSILRGNGVSDHSDGLGGGILVQSGTLQLSNVSVRANTADNGGGIAALGSLFIFNSTVSGNSASALRQTSGGGIVVAADGALGMINTTVTGNTAGGTGSRGGGVFVAGQFAINYSTIANNTAEDGNFMVTSVEGTRSIINSILAATTGDACSGAGIGSMTATNDVADDSSCQLKDPSNRNNANPALGPLVNNGGPTDTLALGAASAAINAAGTCTSQDQRGVTRPQTGSACDSGAYEYRAPTLRVTTTVTNNDGGTRTAADFTVHVREGGADVKGSPRAGSVDGSTYTLDAGGSYVVAADALAGYTITVGGDCNAAGSITLAEGQNRTCTITAMDNPPTLRVITAVTNDNGGTLTPAGVNVHARRAGVELAGSPAAGVAGPNGRLYTTTVGPHAVTADAVSGYTISYSAGCTVTLALDDDVTCTVTLDDIAPTLRVITAVTNDNGGTLVAGDVNVHARRAGVELSGSPAAGLPGPNGRLYTTTPGAHAVTADPVSGYTISYSAGCTVTLALDDDATCTVTVDDIAPTLRVITAVTNDNGGTLVAGGVNVHARRAGVELAGSPAAGLPGPNGRLYATTPGAHTVTADAVNGYDITYSAGCSVTLALDDDATCTVTVDDIAPTLRVITAVTNDDGGTLAPGGVNVHARRAGVEVGSSPDPGLPGPNGRLYTTSTGAHTVTADAVSGYTIAYSAGCTVTLVLDQDATCTVTLDDIAPTLKVVTQVFNDAGGQLGAGDFTIHVLGNGGDVAHAGTSAGHTDPLDAGNYVVSVDAKAGYVATISGDCAANGAVSLALDDDKTCTVRLDDGAAALDVVTNVVNDAGGSLEPDDFTVRVRSAGVDVPGSPAAGSLAGTEYQLAAGAYSVAADAETGYTFALSGDCASNGTITLVLQDERACTVTADDVAPRLTVITRVTNDHGGTATPASLSVHVRSGGVDVASSPQPGAESGTVHTLTAGAYTVAADAPAGYTTTTSGDCAPTLAVGDSRTCTVTADDDAPPVRGQASSQLPPPEPGESVNALPKSGTVKVKPPGAKAYVPLDEARQLPVGTIIDATKGHVTLVAAADDNGGTATAEFWAGIFRLGQTKGATPITTLTLVEKLSCPKRGKASTAAKKKKKRRLWGDGSGKFRTEGQYSSATVRGTRWLVEDTCTTTLTRVVRGRVAVRDFVKRKTVIVRAGKKYVAKAKRR